MDSQIKVHSFYFNQIALLTRYEKLFSNCNNAFIQQSTDWAKAIKDLGPDIPIFLLCEYDEMDVAGMPLYLFDGKYGSILTSIPQPGPVGGVFHLDNLLDDLREIIYEHILKAAMKIAKAHGCLLFSTNTNPLFDDSTIYQKILSPNYIFNNFNQFINLNNKQQKSRSTRYNINKSKRSGLVFVIDKKQKYFESWYNLHKSRHNELDIVPLQRKLFNQLFFHLGRSENINLACVFLENKLISGCVVVFHKNILDIYMLSFDTTYKRLKPNYYCINALIDWAKMSGIKYFNWQSSDFKYSGVYNFKNCWGSEDSDYQILTKIFCPISDLHNIGLENIKKAYQNHYFLPYGVFETDNDKKIFYKGGNS